MAEEAIKLKVSCAACGTTNILPARARGQDGRLRPLQVAAARAGRRSSSRPRRASSTSSTTPACPVLADFYFDDLRRPAT
ncbi:MAG: hypothetical protein MZW92_68570 [Comamonadaceae bacterium]|nr:hypothetical protein [Comamonadaceae bacterium]